MKSDLRPVDFFAPGVVGRERDYVAEVLASKKWGGDGQFSKRCASLIEATLCAHTALLTHSGTAALEMAAILAGLEPGDEVIMPSFTFVSTANAVVLRRAIPVFVDIRPDTLNLDERLIEAAITPRTRAVIVVHYAGVCCAMDEINQLASRRGLVVIEDAAQAYLATYRGKPAGALGDMASISFHETKNLVSGEGGAFITNNAEFARRAEIVREKGTDRSRFLRGEVDKYSWIDIGSSYLPSELIAAVLLAQLERQTEITARRLALWNRYHERLSGIESDGRARRPVVPPDCEHNGHIYYLLLNQGRNRESIIKDLRKHGIVTPFHYVPLHNSPGGLRFGRCCGDLAKTVDLASRLIRLPLHAGLTDGDLDRVCETLIELL